MQVKKKKMQKKNPSNLANPTPQPTHETNNTGMYYLGAIEPCLHSDSKEEDRSPLSVAFLVFAGVFFADFYFFLLANLGFT